MGCRKNLNKLTPAERTAFVNAVNQLRDDGGYDTFVNQHLGAGGHGHGGPAFFAWHREFVLRYEQALQAIDSSVDLPYWDWTVDNLNGSGTESLIWRDDFMGGPGVPGSGFQVMDGPFAAWGIRRSAFSHFSSPGGGGTINTFLTDSTTYSEFRGLEGPHGSPHVWVGGDMGSVPTAVRDPAFFLLHCNVDRLWSEWIKLHESEPGFEPYEPTVGGFAGHNIGDSMWPWNGTAVPFGVPPWTVTPEVRTPGDQVDHRALGYYYDTIDPECRPKLLRENLKIRMPREVFKRRLPAEVVKTRFSKELKEGKEIAPKEFKEGKEIAPKELKERSPKESKDIRETGGRGPFIRSTLRPDLDVNALNFEPDLGDAELRELRALLASRSDRAFDG